MDLETWNDWQEVKEENEADKSVIINPQFHSSPLLPKSDFTKWVKIAGGTLAIAGGIALEAGCTVATAGICGVVVGAGIVGGIALNSATMIESADSLGLFNPLTA